VAAQSHTKPASLVLVWLLVPRESGFFTMEMMRMLISVHSLCGESRITLDAIAYKIASAQNLSIQEHSQQFYLKADFSKADFLPLPLLDAR
jgi:hypothetical protein